MSEEEFKNSLSKYNDTRRAMESKVQESEAEARRANEELVQRAQDFRQESQKMESEILNLRRQIQNQKKKFEAEKKRMQVRVNLDSSANPHEIYEGLVEILGEKLPPSKACSLDTKKRKMFDHICKQFRDSIWKVVRVSL